jgi:hypothetical protein
VGNGGENVYVIDSGSERFEIDKLPMPEVVIYDLDVESLVDTIDLRNLVQQAKGEFSNKDSFELQVLKSANDLLLKATVIEEKPTGDSPISEIRRHEYFTVRLKDCSFHRSRAGVIGVINQVYVLSIVSSFVNITSPFCYTKILKCKW